MSKSPSEFLQELIDDGTDDIEIKIEAAKALLPYTAKKMVQEFSNLNKTQFEVGSKHLAVLDDEELELFIRLLRKIDIATGTGDTLPIHPGTGTTVPEVQ